MTDDILIALVGGAVVLVVWYFQHDRQLRRRLASVAVTPIGDVRPGLVRIVGRVSAKGAPLVAPGTGATCVAYSTLVFTPDGDDRTVVTRFHECTPFWLEDPSGRIQGSAERNKTKVEVTGSLSERSGSGQWSIQGRRNCSGQWRAVKQ